MSRKRLTPPGSGRSLARADTVTGELNLAPSPSQETRERVGLVRGAASHRPQNGSRCLLFFGGEKGKDVTPNHPKTAENYPISARFRSPSPSFPAWPVPATPVFLGPSPCWVLLGTVTSGQPKGPHARSARSPP